MPILTVHEVGIDKTEDRQTKNVINVTAEQDNEQKVVRVTRPVTPKQLYETSILVSTNAKGIVQVDTFE